jgi:hypothetical protein
MAEELHEHRDIEAQYRDQRMEGIRRRRANEGLPEQGFTGWKTGFGHEMGDPVPWWEAAGKSSEEAEFFLWGFDPAGLKSELNDLERDLDNYIRSEGVHFGE